MGVLYFNSCVTGTTAVVIGVIILSTPRGTSTESFITVGTANKTS
jgi:hypothetical protein